MEVTEVRVFLAAEDDDRLKAYVTVTFDNCFVVRDLKVIDGNTGLFVAMPSKKRKDGTYKDIAHPIHSDFRQELENIILRKYEEEIGTTKSQGALQRAPAEKMIERVHTGEKTIANEDEAMAYDTLQDLEAGVGPTNK